jgi:hypothetical protein
VGNRASAGGRAKCSVEEGVQGWNRGLGRLEVSRGQGLWTAGEGEGWLQVRGGTRPQGCQKKRKEVSREAGTGACGEKQKWLRISQDVPEMSPWRAGG